MKNLMAFILLCSLATHADWYRVVGVTSYNTIKAAPANGLADPITIRIRNLEKIEYIQSNPEKVLIGGSDAVNMTKSVLQGQMVWVENLTTEQGTYLADIYPSFEQVMNAYKKRRIMNGDNITPATKEKVRVIYKQMMADLDLKPVITQSRAKTEAVSTDIHARLNQLYSGMLSTIRTSTPKVQGSDPKVQKPKSYDGDFQRALFIMDAIVWFRQKGQYMRPEAQKVFVDLLQSFPNESGAEARYTQIKIEQIMKKESFFKELFLNGADFERGKFTYSCLEWFKNKGQFMPDDVQIVFINWLRLYQQTSSTDGEFMKQRLQWMMDNSNLYQDFLDPETDEN